MESSLSMNHKSFSNFPHSANSLILKNPEYSEEDLEVWNITLKKRVQILNQNSEIFDNDYIQGLKSLDLKQNRIPTLQDLNNKLLSTGWEVQLVNGYISSQTYIKLILQNKFPVACTMRTKEHIDLSPAPDFTHDIFGHLPMLFSAEYRKYLVKLSSYMELHFPKTESNEKFRLNRELSQLKMNNIDDSNPRILEILEALNNLNKLNRQIPYTERLERLFYWTIEFGLFGNFDKHHAYGAGLLSAPIEVESILNRKIKLLPLSIEATDFDICFTGQQNQLFIAENYEHLFATLDQLVNLQT